MRRLFEFDGFSTGGGFDDEEEENANDDDDADDDDAFFDTKYEAIDRSVVGFNFVLKLLLRFNDILV